MKLTTKDSKGALTKTDLLAILATEGSKVALPKGVKVPDLARKAFQGEFRETRLTDATSGPAQRVVQIGLGKGAEVSTERLRRAAAIAVKKAQKVRAGSVALWLSPALEKAVGGPAEAGQAAAEGALLGGYSYQECKSKKDRPTLKSIVLYGGGAPLRRGAQHGVGVATGNCFARDLQEAPGNLMRPRDMAAQARKLATKSPKLRCKTLDEATMKKLGMGSLLSVSRGSEEPAYLIHLTYRPKGRVKGKVALVGKGLTFDAGGISIKPSAKMDEMKYDMSGGAAVLGVFRALSEVDVPYEVHGLVPTSENLPDGKANKPGDVVTAMNGLTIEVLNTDAEGRLILCDALTYAVKKIKPDTIVDLATLTGAVVVALGHELSGVMSNSEALSERLVAAGQRTGELVWPLPLLDCHKRHMKGRVADLRNINAGQGAGSTAGAAFLSNFVEDVDWAHLDIAGTAWGAEDRDYQGGAGGTGVGVRLLLDFLRQ